MNGLAVSLVRQHWRALVAGGALMVVARVAVLAVPAIAKVVYDDVITGDRPGLLLPLAAAALAAMILAALTTWLLTLVVSSAAESTITQLRTRLYRHVLRLPIGRLDAERVGALVPRIMTDPDGVGSLVGTGVIQLAGGTVTVVVGTAILLWLDWRLTIGTLVLLAAFAAATAFAVARLRRIHGDIATTFADVSGRVGETLSGILTVRAAGTTAREERRFSEGAARLQRLTTRSLLDSALLSAFAGVTAGAISVVLMVVGGGAVLRGELSPGELIWFALTMGVVARPLASLAAASAQVTHALAGLDRMAAILAMPLDDADRADAQGADRGGRVTTIAGAVQLDRVSCRREDGSPLLSDISFTAAPGTLTVIIGPNGAGKTTLLQLLLGLRSADAGSVLVDGCDLRDLDMAAYRRQVGFMLQDPFLVHGTIRDNIAYPLDCADDGQAHPADDGRVQRAAVAAGARAFIERLPAGYDTVLGERGAGLSAGERQRIALARALITQPRILLLDEPTASLDTASEHAVLQDLLRSRAGRTTFLVTHNLEALRGADQVLVMEDGRVRRFEGRDFLRRNDAAVTGPTGVPPLPV